MDDYGLLWMKQGKSASGERTWTKGVIDDTVANGIKFSQEVRPERVTTNIVCILYHIITIHPLAPRRRPPIIILSLCSVYLAHNTPLPVPSKSNRL